MWAYPLQVLSGYTLAFHTPARVAPLDGRALLRRVESTPTEVTRTYVGPDFTVRERLFAPLNAPAALVSYEVEGRPDVRIEVRFQPSLDLMWPGGIGGQEAGWDAVRSGYLLREPVHGFSALVRSAETVAHDDTANAATGRGDTLALVLAPRPSSGGVRRAELAVTAVVGEGSAPDLPADAERLRSEAQASAEAARAESVEITTPDPAVNRALADAAVALDQAWVCAPNLGCGEVAGYGPSRPGRRPQYAWYFAGDGLVAVEGQLAAGRFERAREELAFIARYQNRTNGMIWHEMSLSAPLIDWERRYPYMFVHVDITHQYLATLARYLETTGDRAYVQAHWAGIAAAWRYCLSLLDPATGLPTIPPGKQGQNEQARMRDDVRLSSAWLDAADGFAHLAQATGHAREAAAGERAAARARASLSAGAWDGTQGFWLSGHTLDGAPVHDQRSDASRLLGQGVLTPAQADAALDRLVSPEFQTDWGVHSLSRDAAGYDPNTYGDGAVWGLGTSAAAQAFWDAHRPLAGWSAWRGLVGWNTLDSAGHLHEVLAGDLFHPERESVPEQTWSSAGFLSAAVHGLLGAQAHGGEARLDLAPHLPGDWPAVTVKRLRVGPSRVDLFLEQNGNSVSLTARADGPPVQISFAPELPLGAHVLGATAEGRTLSVRLEPQAQDQHARIEVTARAEPTRSVIRFEGGVQIVPVASAPLPGDPSRNPVVTSTRWEDGRLVLEAVVRDPARAAIDLLTPMTPTTTSGGVLSASGPGAWRLALDASGAADARGERRVRAVVGFGR